MVILRGESIVELVKNQKYEQALNVGYDATREEINKAKLSLQLEYQNDPDVKIALDRAKTILVEELYNHEKGMRLSQIGEKERAIPFLKKAVESRGNVLDYHWLGSTLVQLGKPQEAIPFLEKAIELRGDEIDHNWLRTARDKITSQQTTERLIPQSQQRYVAIPRNVKKKPPKQNVKSTKVSIYCISICCIFFCAIFFIGFVIPELSPVNISHPELPELPGSYLFLTIEATDYSDFDNGEVIEIMFERKDLNSEAYDNSFLMNYNDGEIKGNYTYSGNALSLDFDSKYYQNDWNIHFNGKNEFYGEKSSKSVNGTYKWMPIVSQNTINAFNNVRYGIGQISSSAYNNTEPGIHPLIVISSNGGRHELTDKLRTDWRADIENTELVLVCGERQEMIIEVVHYYGPDITRYQYYMQIWLREAKSGKLIASDTIYGDPPRACRYYEPYGFTELWGNQVDIHNWTQPYVNIS